MIPLIVRSHYSLMWGTCSPEMLCAAAGQRGFHRLALTDTDNLYGLHDKGAPLRPLVKTHPETGRKSIYTGRHAYGIPGMSEAESAELLSGLLQEACRPPRVYTHKWQAGDLVVWDNRCLMHRARPYDADYPRVLRGTRISGDPATELAPTHPDPRATGYKPSQSNLSSIPG